jgi:hypothetical protein
MSIVNYTNANAGNANGYALANWSGLTGGDTGQPFPFPNFADKTVQVFGTIGAAITIQGSNDGTNWETLTDNFGGALIFNTHGLSLIAQAPLWVRPSCAAGTTNATVIILANQS